MLCFSIYSPEQGYYTLIYHWSPQINKFWGTYSNEWRTSGISTRVISNHVISTFQADSLEEALIIFNLLGKNNG